MIVGNQIRLSGLMLFAIVAAWAVSSYLSRTTTVIEDRVEREQALQIESNGMYLYDGGYVDDGDLLLLDQLPNADFSRGGVYFIGSSETRASLMPWTLPEAEQKLIYNLSIGDLRHREIEYYLRMLVEDFDLLEAGGKKNTVVLSSFAFLARPKAPDGPMDQYVGLLFERHGQYDYDWEEGIYRRQQNPLERWYRTEKDHANRFLSGVFTAHESRVHPITEMDWRHDHLVFSMGEDWENFMKVEVERFAQTLDYLLDRDVHVIVLRPPVAAWQLEYPYEPAYRAMVAPILEARNIPVADFGDFLEDEEFGDHVHAVYSAQVKLHNAYRALALEELARMGTDVVE